MDIVPGRMRKYFELDLLREIPWHWVLWWLLLPNLAIIAMWPVGGPSMVAPILLGGLFALIAAQRNSRIVRVIAIAMIFAFIAAVYMTNSFNIDLVNVVHTHQYIGELDPIKSPEYLIAGLLFAISLISALVFGSVARKFSSWKQYLMALAAIGLLLIADAHFTAGTRGSYKAVAPPGTPIDSAVLQNGIRPDTLRAKNLIIIVVESWGVPNNPVDRQIDRDIWDTRQLDRYTATRGISKYYGSTTNGELRELCGVWSDHHAFDFDNANCLPRQFSEAGFGTMAFHSFRSTFFGRWEWYPKLGFEAREFAPELAARGARPCSGVFPGICDADVPALLGERLRSSGAQRNLVYWLTLNAHIPVGPDDAIGTDRCILGTAEWRQDFPMLCRSYAVHKSVADAIFQEISAEDFPESDILIVGDHMPPFFQRTIRSRFDPAYVPWLYLRNREALARAEG